MPEKNLDVRNRAIAIAESLARVIAAIGIIGDRWQSYFPPKTQKSVLVDLAFVVPPFKSGDWHPFVQCSFHVELRNGLRELTTFADHWRLAIGDFAHLKTV